MDLNRGGVTSCDAGVRRARRIALLVIVAAAIQLPRAAHAVTLSATQDSWLDQDSPATNNGSAAVNNVKSELTKLRRTIVQFDVTSIPSCAAVTSATLRLWVQTNASAANRTHGAHRITNSWTESGVTWNERQTSTAWSTAGGDFVAAPTSTTTTGTITGVFIAWDVTTDVAAFTSGAATNFGWLIKDTVEGPTSVTIGYASKDHGDAFKRPQLVVTYGAGSCTPTPGPATNTPTTAPTATHTATTVPTATNTATAIPTDTATAVPTDTATPVPTDTATPVPTDTATAVPTDTATNVPTDTATAVPTDTATAVPTDTATEVPSDTPTTQPTDTPTGLPTATDTATPLPTNTPSLTRTPTDTPTTGPSLTPSSTRTNTASPTPTATPTSTGTATPTDTPICPPVPNPACKYGESSRPARFRIRPDKNKIIWKWRTNTGSGLKSDFGDPLNTSFYALCIYADRPTPLVGEYEAPAGGTCAGKPCWKDKPKGFKYRDKDTTPDGLRKILLRITNGPLADIIVVGRGPILSPPALPLPETGPVTIQLVRSDDSSQCWQNVFTPPFKKNFPDRFADRSDP